MLSVIFVSIPFMLVFKNISATNTIITIILEEMFYGLKHKCIKIEGIYWKYRKYSPPCI